MEPQRWLHQSVANPEILARFQDNGHGHWLGDLRMQNDSAFRKHKRHEDENTKDEMMMILPYFLGGKGHHKKKLKRKKRTKDGFFEILKNLSMKVDCPNHLGSKFWVSFPQGQIPQRFCGGHRLIEYELPTK